MQVNGILIKQGYIQEVTMVLGVSGHQEWRNAARRMTGFHYHDFKMGQSWRELGVSRASTLMKTALHLPWFASPRQNVKIWEKHSRHWIWTGACYDGSSRLTLLWETFSIHWEQRKKMTPTLGEEQRENAQRLNSCVFFVVVFFLLQTFTPIVDL